MPLLVGQLIRNGLLGAMLCLLFAAPGVRADEPPIDWSEARGFWSFRAPRSVSVPAVKNSAWPRNRIDRFILAELEANGLSPSEPAPEHQLIRRLCFDLTGLPPSPEVLGALATANPDAAYDALVGRLVAGRSFGERMASMWLNVARYAEDQAHIVGKNTSLSYPNAFRYRAWVIDAFNRDLPYDEFIRRQLAADLIAPANPADLPALGYMGLGHKYYSRSRIEVRADEWAEKVDTLSRSLLGLTVACARCHDHKYDPITMQDYYGLAGVFANLKMVNKTSAGVYEKTKTLAEKMSPDTLHLIEESGAATNLTVFLRGDVNTPGPEVPRGFLRVLAADHAIEFQQGSGRRELAEQIATRENPLTSRVFVNRIWAMLFGRGLVGTPSNFGRLGDLPTHPELLDDLAVRFMDHGWSVKWLVKELVRSATYRQSSAAKGENAAIDEANRFWWRMNRRRLSIEQFRDAVLAVAGSLDPLGGKSLELAEEGNLRRTVYARISRRELDHTMTLFDYPDANAHAARRSASTTAPQKLYVMNSPFLLARAKEFASRLAVLADNDSERIERAYRIAYGRRPTETERSLGLLFLSGEPAGRMTALDKYAHALLAANEMIYLD